MIKIPKNFILGAATSSYQIEGACEQDGKGPSIWDSFVKIPGKIKDNDTGNIACDHYNRYLEDIELMKKLNLEAYRFSVSWARIMPTGSGKVNPKGLKFYTDLVDALLANGIEPCLTLYHWDLPQALQDQGGWQNKKTIDAFIEYSKIVFKALNGKVKKWITFNESYIVANLGYGTGLFAPGIADPKADILVSHNLNIAHARTVKLFRQMDISGKIGTAICTSPVIAMENTTECENNRRIVDGLWNRWFLEPVLLGTYPQDMIDLHHKQGTLPEITEQDLAEFKEAKVDFIGLNYYQPFRIFSTPANEPFNWNNCINIKQQTEMKYSKNNWEFYPEGLYMVCDRIRKDYGNIELYITENGTAVFDENFATENGILMDDERLEYIKGHLKQCMRAIDDGINLKGYYYWSLFDNFEWSSGYDLRFGIVQIDFTTLKRSIKKSGYWYAKTIEKRGL